MIEFKHLATKLGSKRKADPPKRRLKKAPNWKIQSNDDKKVISRVGYRQKEQSEDRWYQLSLEPVKFIQYHNGTVTDIFVARSDIGK